MTDRMEKRLQRLRRRAWRALAWERAAPLLWPVPTLAVVFLTLAGFDLAPRLPGWLHAGVLALLVILALSALVRAARRWRAPTMAAVERRIELDSGARHRPLAARRDRVEAPMASGAGDDGLAQALWAAHRRRLDAAAAGLRVSRARPDMAAADPWGLRHLALLLLFVAAVGAQGDWGPRLTAALSPSFDSSGVGGGPAVVDAWLTPPDATGLAPIFLSMTTTTTAAAAGEAAAPIAVPAGSRLTARVNGGAGAPDLRINGSTVAFLVVDGRSFQIEATVRGGETIAVRQRGRTLAEWPITVIADEPPDVVFVAPPTAVDSGALRIDYAAADDYGLARISLRVTPAGESESAPPIQEYPLSLPGLRLRQAESGGLQDLTAHPWAGLPAVLTLIAADTGGQSGESESVTMVLPERRFVHPVARALVAARRRLTLDGERVRPAVMTAIRILAAAPAAYGGDKTAFLAMIAAAGRLDYDSGARALTEAGALLWETALRIEDGGVSQAERALRQAQQALADALDRGVSENELQGLMAQLQDAMDGWLNAVEQQMRRSAENGAPPPPALPPELAAQLTDRAELQAMLDRVREMAQTGARDAARQMLSQMQQMLEQMQAGGQPAPPQGQNQAFELLRRLRELTDRQQELQDETFRQSQQGLGDTAAQRRRARTGRNQTASPLMQKQAEKQQSLRRQLGETMAEIDQLLGESPRPLGRAERQMRDAETALRGGAPEAAVDPQGEAVEELRQGLESLVERIARQMLGGMSGAMAPQASGAGRDPLGRPQGAGGGQMDTSSARTPTDQELQRARDILQELRRRAGETARPQPERDYIDRLLRRFQGQ